ncbi:hypothetical protein M441DRAFT_374115 [Trichoderma asperellum CBS 433.97]|uniref:Uncharacterized protein n=1 Tax=Trichoderma asperellum (strain ATCC 204424 / CBS 433.97 / NBRC 101777) TaxID=1042311 RepID=A0A2T3ZFD9_TRIA4|nr:hypothetical protein M441DRAFT_374115 [Trichoderma asperellum CBS 433.97]PTB43516.1 hypothetical protein M441DRAFT_374115 [Trichoderma asperellum CBS 433.97]
MHMKMQLSPREKAASTWCSSSSSTPIPPASISTIWGILILLLPLRGTLTIQLHAKPSVSSMTFNGPSKIQCHPDFSIVLSILTLFNQQQKPSNCPFFSPDSSRQMSKHATPPLLLRTKNKTLNHHL